MPGSSTRSNDGLVLSGIALALSIGLLFVGPIAQSPCYHDFADQETFAGIPHFFNVISNAPFLVVGLLRWRRFRATTSFADPLIRDTFHVLVFLVGLGSSWYHLHPTDETLVWDRLPIALVSMTVLLMALQDFGILARARAWLVPGLILGGLSVAHWAFTNRGDGGDLRSYILVSILAAVVVLYGLVMRPGRSRHLRTWIWVLIFYALSRLTEVLDHQVDALPFLMSGHTWKHLFAAAACLVLSLQMLPLKLDPPSSQRA